MTTTNVNILTNAEWRMIHNALCTAQSAVHWSNPKFEERKQHFQQLMDKVRDNYIERDDACVLTSPEQNSKS